MPKVLGPSETSPPQLSVVLASDGRRAALADRIEALARACRGVPTEVVLVQPGQAPVGPFEGSTLPVTLVTAPAALVPVQWGHGIAAARGDVIALTTTQFRAREGWAHALLDRFERDDPAGVGGTIDLASKVGMLGRAAYLLRYSEHMPSATAETPADLPGENAAYRRTTVLALGVDLPRGFWEVDVHRLIRAAGGSLVHAPRAVVEYDPVLSWGGMLLNRFVHGSHYGAFRVRQLGWPRWKAVLVTPLVPGVLLLRILQRVRARGRSLAWALAALPALLPLLLAWAAGEALGAIRRTALAYDVA